eukprot:TRINITY_DN102038_c0_g1_i1.p1 TRINITY_DN102038_c0_g1~~TRINITY_DN102038_c0_g1_i1.p1  ORF type:complete len:388 (-),score=54.33 TRINITY_DN102038_c0_g1_i1:547-1710(-)
MSVPCRHYARGYCQLGSACGFLHEPAQLSSPMAALLGLQTAGSNGMQNSSPSNHKTVPCRHFERGYCQMGDACNFLHKGAQPYAQPGVQSVGAAPVSSPGNYKRVPCRHFASGYCQLGEACNFLHAEAEAPAKRPVWNAWEDFTSPQGAAEASWPPAKRQHVGGRVKTQLCSNFAAGYCKYANKCSFAHGEHDIGTPLADSASAQSNGFAQIAYAAGAQVKTKMCVNFEASGTCSYGSKCTFAHGEHEMGSPVASTQGYRKSKICTLWESGNCNRPVCNFAHGEDELGTPQSQPQAPVHMASWPTSQSSWFGASPSYVKSKLCTLWEQGNCNRAVCTFAHGSEELGKPQKGGGKASGKGAELPVGLCGDFSCGKCEICLIAKGEIEA